MNRLRVYQYMENYVKQAVRAISIVFIFSADHLRQKRISYNVKFENVKK